MSAKHVCGGVWKSGVGEETEKGGEGVMSVEPEYGYNKNKHLASADMTEALLKSHKAYFEDATPVNMDAYLACLTAVNKMLEPYYMEEVKPNV